VATLKDSQIDKAFKHTKTLAVQMGIADGNGDFTSPFTKAELKAAFQAMETLHKATTGVASGATLEVRIFQALPTPARRAFTANEGRCIWYGWFQLIHGVGLHASVSPVQSTYLG
jgi:hypothetical protein